MAIRINTRDCILILIQMNNYTHLAHIRDALDDVPLDRIAIVIKSMLWNREIVLHPNDCYYLGPNCFTGNI